MLRVWRGDERGQRKSVTELDVSAIGRGGVGFARLKLLIIGESIGAKVQSQCNRQKTKRPV
jgi:hypothetical protein